MTNTGRGNEDNHNAVLQHHRGRKVRTDDERSRIEGATAQLLERLRTDATSWPTVCELARVAGVKRWILTHKHTDLKEQFQAEVERLKAAGVSLPLPKPTAPARQILQQEVARLRRENAELREQVVFYTHALNAVGMEYHALATKCGSASNVLSLPVRSPYGGGKLRDPDDPLS